jgi:hypothetical protein
VKEAASRRGRHVAQRAVRRAAQKGEPWTDRIARAGYVARGGVYVVVGGLTLAAATGAGGEPTDPSGALAALVRVPAGRGALALVALGLRIHVAFRAMLAVTGEPSAEQGRWWRRVATRVRHGFSACLYFGLALTAALLAAGRSGRHAQVDKDAQTRSISAWLLAAPAGRPILIAVSAGILIAAAVQIVRALGPNDVRKRLRTDAMTERQCELMAALGRVAYVARAAVLAVCGYFLARGAIDRAPEETRGPAGALRTVWALPQGGLWLALIAAGLVAFGAYGILEAKWRRVFASAAKRR